MNNIFGENLKQHCCGCRACEQICPQNCIQIKQDDEGFLLPFYVKKNVCNECGACLSVCPTMERAPGNKTEFAYGLIHNDISITAQSASGGAFSAFASYVLDRGGAVFGCIMDDEFSVLTACARNWEELKAMHSSKYVQCDTNTQYSRIRELLKTGQWVLYCSTPCQIAGLKKYLGKEYDKLILIDLFCHGVPSQGLFTAYIEHLSKIRRHKVKYLTFRDGGREWGTNGYYMTDKRKYNYNEMDPFYYSFLLGQTYAPVCYSCPYANALRVGDITIGDFWGVNDLHTSVNTTRGVSAVLINTPKGKRIFDCICDQIELFETTFDNISRNNSVLIEPTRAFAERDELYQQFQNLPMKRFVRRYLGPHFGTIQRIKLSVYHLLLRLRLNFLIQFYRNLKMRRPSA